MTDVKKKIREFVSKLEVDLNLWVALMAGEAVLEAFDPRGRNAPKAAQRRKGPIQLCPVPNCKNRAAPVFGMVCAKHKDLPKATIKKYREARRQRTKAAKKSRKK